MTKFRTATFSSKEEAKLNAASISRNFGTIAAVRGRKVIYEDDSVVHERSGGWRRKGR